MLSVKIKSFTTRSTAQRQFRRESELIPDPQHPKDCLQRLDVIPPDIVQARRQIIEVAVLKSATIKIPAVQQGTQWAQQDLHYRLESLQHDYVPDAVVLGPDVLQKDHVRLNVYAARM